MNNAVHNTMIIVILPPKITEGINPIKDAANPLSNAPISFDDPISRYLPELPPSIGDKMLVRHLITHTSGIIDYGYQASAFTKPAASSLCCKTRCNK